MAETPHPKAILRGHKAQVHALSFVRGKHSSQRLVSGDADGFVAVWDLTIMRAVAVWRPHESAILGIQGWGDDRIITHGRDHKLAVWKLGPSDEAGLSTQLPLDDTPESRPQPWLLNLIEVNTMNFCTFASCEPRGKKHDDNQPEHPSEQESDQKSEPELLIAVPNTLASDSIDIFHLPSQARLHTVRTPGGSSHGMVMALALLHLGDNLALVAGYENGTAIVLQQGPGDNTWAAAYSSTAHSQPVLSLDLGPHNAFFVTSSADATIAKHPLLTAAASMRRGEGRSGADTDDPALGLPIKVSNTKHAGQQSLRFRDDGRIFATGGWDAMIRVYSSKTLKEVAVLKWHQVGCYAVAMADVVRTQEAAQTAGASGPDPSERAVAPLTRDLSVKDRRIYEANSAHWLAAGSKDGKISLWDVF